MLIKVQNIGTYIHFFMCSRADSEVILEYIKALGKGDDRCYIPSFLDYTDSHKSYIRTTIDNYTISLYDEHNS